MKRVVRVLTTMMAVAALAAPAMSASSTDEPPDWRPPKDSEWDWLHLTSGEWLKGEMEGLRDRDIWFDSDNLDDLVIDWEDVRALYLRRPHIFRLESDENLQGYGVMRDDVLTVTLSEGSETGTTREVPRDQIVSIIAGDGSELDYWSSYLGADATMRNGNVDQTDLGGRAGFKRETANTRWRGDYRGLYSSAQNQKTDNNHRASSYFDVFLTSRFYVTTPFIEYYKDEFQNLKHRISPGVGVGYEFIRNRWAELDVLVGGAYQRTEFESAPSDEDDTSDDAAVVVKASLDFDLPRGVELDNLYQLNAVVTNSDLTTHHFESTLSTDIWGPIELDVTFMFDRTEKPERTEPGNRPDSNDTRIIAGLSVDF